MSLALKVGNVLPLSYCSFVCRRLASDAACTRASMALIECSLSASAAASKLKVSSSVLIKASIRTRGLRPKKTSRGGAP